MLMLFTVFWWTSVCWADSGLTLFRCLHYGMLVQTISLTTKRISETDKNCCSCIQHYYLDRMCDPEWYQYCCSSWDQRICRTWEVTHCMYWQDSSCHKSVLLCILSMDSSGSSSPLLQRPTGSSLPLSLSRATSHYMIIWHGTAWWTVSHHVSCLISLWVVISW